MKPAQAEKLLGGYAAGILTEAERAALFAAALERQDLFDALVDEEALRELLADPAARAQLLGALAPTAAKPIALWRHPGLLSAAAGLLLAVTAGLAYLRSPDQTPPSLGEAASKAPAPKVPESPGPTAGKPADPAPPAPARALRKAAPAPSMAAQTEAPPPPPPAQAVAVAEDAARSRLVEARERKAEAKGRPAPEATVLTPGLASGHTPGGVIGGVVGGVVGGAAKPSAVVSVLADLGIEPSWSFEPGPDGSTRVTVRASGARQALLLKRGASGLEVLNPLAREDREGAFVLWRFQVRLAPGETLDLYLLNHPVADPAKLPETGPVDGFRARIHPAP